MSKLLFATVLRQKHEVSNCQLDYFWAQAKTANLPESIFFIIKPHIHLFPEIQDLYRKKGWLDGLTCKQQVKDQILGFLKNGGQYTRSIIGFVPAHSDLTITCLNELLNAERIKFSYCMVENSRFYTVEHNYLNIQQSILRVLNKNDAGADKHQICNEVKGVKKKAIRQNITDLLRTGQIQHKQGKYTC